MDTGYACYADKIFVQYSSYPDNRNKQIVCKVKLWDTFRIHIYSGVFKAYVFVKVVFFQKVLAKFSNFSKCHSCEPKIVPELLIPVNDNNKILVIFWICILHRLLIKHTKFSYVYINHNICSDCIQSLTKNKSKGRISLNRVSINPLTILMTPLSLI